MIYYLGVRFTKETNQLLSEYRLINGLYHKTRPKLDFHTTIIYSRTPFKFQIEQLPKCPIGVVGRNIELWETSLVLTFHINISTVAYDPQYLYDMYDEVIRKGGQSDYPIYKPHITITEDCETIPIMVTIPIVKEMFIPIMLSEIFYLEWE